MKIDTPLISQIPALRSLWQEAFDDTDEFLDNFYTTAFCTDRCRCVTADGTVIAALYWFDCFCIDKRVAYIYAVATSKAFRGQGICHKLMKNTHRHLMKLGYEGAILVPGSKALFHFYESIGYQTCCRIREFSCTGTETTLSPCQIDKTEYAKQRRQLLPENGVIQENENLNFLQAQAKFYTGFGFLLACYAENDTLYGIELLGDETTASEIVHALGYTKGIFRTPGEDVPFAMYYSLAKSGIFPTYFGLAFD